jgi:hypothetical protein
MIKGRMGFKERILFGKCGLRDERKRGFNFWEPTIPVSPEEKETFGKGEQGPKIGNSLGASGFLE